MSRSVILLLPGLLACTEPAPSASDTAVSASGPSFVPLADDGLSVSAVEPERYLGLWYEIATTPSGPQQSCTGTTAEYSLLDSGDIRVLNRCYLDSLDGALSEIEGSASFVDDSYARLLVDFGFGFTAPYNIVELDGSDGEEPYEFAVVSSSGVLMWVLSRTPEMDPDLYALLLERADDQDLPIDRLVETVQVE